MDKNAIKSFAIWARQTLIEQVSARATLYGITPKELASVTEVQGGLLVAGQTLDEAEAKQYRQLRGHLEDLRRQMKQPQAIAALVEEIAYTWFNRWVALRYMEVNGYISTRVLSSSDAGLVDPDILREAGEIAELETLPGLDFPTLQEWRQEGQKVPNPDEWVYRRLLLCQCGALGESLPFLFDRKKDYLALFLPMTLLNADSVVRRLVADIPEGDWLAKGMDAEDSQDVEIIGWLYQFYISERKDAVIGAKSKVEAQDIPAATQLFTPHWIVRYMVENSIINYQLTINKKSLVTDNCSLFIDRDGAWIGDYKLAYYVPSREVRENVPVGIEGISLDFTLCDPACGSGHILVYAFAVLFHLYKSQGYADREIPRLILEKHLYGLDIDERAVQLTSFALLMKARAVDRRILRNPPRLNLAVVRRGNREVLDNLPGLGDRVIWEVLIDAFQDADSLGSLIVPPKVDLRRLRQGLTEYKQNNPAFSSACLPLEELLLQTELLGRQYDIVVANPPYMGSKSFNPNVKEFVNKHYKAAKSDLYACFVLRNLQLCQQNGVISMLTIPNWMFLSSFEDIRKYILENTFLESLVHNGRGIFGSDFGSCSFTICNRKNSQGVGTFKRLFDKQGSVASIEELRERFLDIENYPNFYTKPADFAKIPGSAIAYWVS
ncbi:BREX-1 system adenine-specific DNA-methyltransferase PglX, partial [Spirulina sp. 06S082]|uniref:BREX-1 system adenine-specific DNA-methyltransferase PglX n=1 Tax=Spirulina sp. 06S082 TaxID=3110248 RepID=UPI002B21D4FC